MLVAGMVTFGSCVGDDIDSLQDQINDLEQEVGDLQAAQQAALEAQVATLLAEIEALQAANDNQDDAVQAEIDALLAQLAILETTVADNKAEVFFGNLTNPDEYAALANQAGAKVVTGDVIVNTIEEAALLANIVMVSGDLDLNVAADLNIETVGGKLEIKGLNENGAVISFPNLSIVGVFKVDGNTGITSISADELKYANEIRHSGTNMSLLSFAKLIAAGYVEVNGADWNAEVPTAGPAEVNLNGANVGDLSLSYVHGDNLKISVGEVAGNCKLMWSGRADLEVLGTTIGGKLEVKNNQSVSVNAPNLEVIEGGSSTSFFNKAIDISNNFKSGDMSNNYQDSEGIRMMNFDNLKVAHGCIFISGNRYVLTDINTFNNLEEMSRGYIKFVQHRSDLVEVNVFNKIQQIMTNAYIELDFSNVTTNVVALSALEQAQKVKLTTNTTVLNDYCGMKPFFDNVNNGTYTGLFEVLDNNVMVTDLGGWVGAVTANCSGGGIGIGI